MIIVFLLLLLLLLLLLQIDMDLGGIPSTYPDFLGEPGYVQFLQGRSDGSPVWSLAVSGQSRWSRMFLQSDSVRPCSLSKFEFSMFFRTTSQTSFFHSPSLSLSIAFILSSCDSTRQGWRSCSIGKRHRQAWVCLGAPGDRERRCGWETTNGRPIVLHVNF